MIDFHLPLDCALWLVARLSAGVARSGSDESAVEAWWAARGSNPEPAD